MVHMIKCSTWETVAPNWTAKDETISRNVQPKWLSDTWTVITTICYSYFFAFEPIRFWLDFLRGSSRQPAARERTLADASVTHRHYSTVVWEFFSRIGVDFFSSKVEKKGALKMEKNSLGDVMREARSNWSAEEETANWPYGRGLGVNWCGSRVSLSVVSIDRRPHTVEISRTLHSDKLSICFEWASHSLELIVNWNGFSV